MASQPINSPGTDGAASKDPRSESVKVKRGLRYKFGLSITFLLTATILFLSFFALRDLEMSLRQEMEQRGITIARNMAVNALKPLLRGEILSLSVLVNDAMENKSVVYAALVDDKNMVVSHNILEKSGQPYAPPDGVSALGEKPMLISDPFQYLNNRAVDIAIPILLKTAKLGEAHIGLSQSQIDQAIQKTVTQFIILALIFVIIGILVTLVLVRLIVRPIKALEAGAALIGHGDLDYVIPVKSNDEIGNLARSFNRMTSDLKGAQKSLIEKEKLEQELETARKIQNVLLPKSDPILEDFEIVSYYKSAKEVGGDYYDFHLIPKNLLGLTIADVSGKGVPGSLGMVMTRSILRSQTYLADAFQTLSRTNALLYQDIKRGMFVTMLYVLLDLKQKSIQFANAGHNPLLLAHAGGKVEVFNPPGIAMGLDKGERFNAKMQAVSISLKPGDAFLLYTDGITEAMNIQEKEFGEERLVEILGRNIGLPASGISAAVIQGLADFTQDAPQHDDITLMTVKVK